MGLNLEYTDGQTPLNEDEKEGLLITSITTKGELDELEQMNIEKAIEWTLKKKWNAEKIFTEEFIRDLHKKMFNEVWGWAGEFRNTNKNLGVDKHQIRIQLKYLLDDVKYWTANEIYSSDEIAIRFKHRIVNIHCFPNGNGRHSRLIADVIIENVFKKPVFTWGSLNLSEADNIRKQYLAAIKQADNGVIEPLIHFART